MVRCEHSRAASPAPNLKTTFTIAHRLSTVRDADKLVVLEDGAVVESNTHDELLTDEEVSAHLWREQLGEVEALPSAFVERIERRAARTSADD